MTLDVKGLAGRFDEPGLFLLFDDGRELLLTRRVVDAYKQRYLTDPSLLPAPFRTAAEYRPCAVCPSRDTAVICHSIPTVFPFLEDLDRYISYDRVTVVFRAEPGGHDNGDEILHLTRTTMQRALQYVAILSLIYYCGVGRKYFKYFTGVIPFMDPELIAERIYTNLYLDLRGDERAINELIARMRYEVDFTVRCQLKRLELLCRNDAFMNAFANMHTCLFFLAPEMLPDLRRRVAERIAPPITHHCAPSGR